MHSLLDDPLHSLVTAIRTGKTCCVDIARESLSRSAAKDASVKAYIKVLDTEALDQAHALDALSEAEKATLPLLGVPIAIKDNICTQGITTTCASKALENFVPPYNAAVIEMLHKAGAVIVGKTNLDEFAMGSSTENSYFGSTKNPVDTSRIPGGSSGGSAAAVAAGYVPLSLGSDTGGSIRQPASHCGVIGLKPTYGRVSRYGLVAFASSLDQIGPFGNHMQDIGTLLEVISQPDGRDSTNAQKPFVNEPGLYSGSLAGKTIGIPKEYFGEGLSGEVKDTVMQTLDKLTQAGARCIDISLPNVNYGIATYYIICTAEASSNLARFDGVKYGYRSNTTASLTDMYTSTREEAFGAEVKRRIMLGTYVLSAGYYDAYYLKAARVRTLIGQDFDRAFTQCDVIASPTAPTTAFCFGEKSTDPLQMYLSDIYTVSANLAGIPAMSVPCKTKGSLPIGLHLMAPKWREDVLLSMGFAAMQP